MEHRKIARVIAAFSDLTFDRMRHVMWSFGRAGQGPYTTNLRLLPDGRIGGYTNPAEIYWELGADGLTFQNRAGVATTRFTGLESGPAGLTLSGHTLGGGEPVEHFLQETPPPYQLCHDPGQFKLDIERAGPKRRNLVLMGANEKSLHHRWARNISDEDRNWDLAISFYGKAEHYPPPGFCEYASLQTGKPKWLAMHAAMHEGSPFWDYERIMMIDDDIDTTWSDINRFFQICRDFDLWLAQPALNPEFYCTHPITIHQPAAFLRYTNFVEVMMPCFKTAILRPCIEMAQGGHYGFGLDHFWPILLGDPMNRVAIVDAVMMNHTRPFGNNYDVQAAKAEEQKLFALYNLRVNFFDLREVGRITNPAAAK